jgi:hypothetical protein
VLSLYDKHKLSRVDALDRLTTMGYSIDDATLLISTKDTSIVETEAHTLFMNGGLTANDFIDLVLSYGFTYADIDAYFDALGSVYDE